MNQVAARVSMNASICRRGSAQRDVLEWRASLVSESPNGENARVLTLAMWARWMFALADPAAYFLFCSRTRSPNYVAKQSYIVPSSICTEKYRYIFNDAHVKFKRSIPTSMVLPKSFPSESSLLLCPSSCSYKNLFGYGLATRAPARRKAD